MKKMQENKRVSKSPSSKSNGVVKKTPAKKSAKPRSKAANRSRTTPSPPGKKTASKPKSSRKSQNEVYQDELVESLANAPNQSESDEQQKDIQELRFPGGLETLLPCKAQKPLPQLQERVGRKCLLVEIVHHAPELYQTLITQIKCGVSMNVAVEVVGINESTFFSWGWKGKRDYDARIDSYFSRFYKDVRKAVAHKAAECERSIAESSPLKYLTHGPGRIFNNPWGKDKSKKGIGSDGNGNPRIGYTPGGHGQPALPAPDEALEATFSVVPSIEDDDEQGDEIEGEVVKHPSSSVANNGRSGSLSLTPDQEAEALKVLGGIGQIVLSPDGTSIQLSDSLVNALREQAGIEEEKASPTK